VGGTINDVTGAAGSGGGALKPSGSGAKVDGRAQGSGAVDVKK
jgi:hypothetical protein